MDDPAIINGDFNSSIYLDIAKRGQIFASDIEGLAEDIVFEISKFPNMAPSPLTPWMETGHICLIIKISGMMYLKFLCIDQNGDKTFQTIYVFAQINHPIVTTLQPLRLLSDPLFCLAN